jgi:hypothetical protein
VTTLQDTFRYEQRANMAIKHPRNHAAIVNLTEQNAVLAKGFSIEESKAVGEGKVYRIGSKLVAAPLTFFAITHSGLYPFESRHTAGAREARRDRRRHA